jgi:hypothetical protein
MEKTPTTLRAGTDSNWSSGFTIWDWLHGILHLNVPQDGITIGVPACQKAQEASFAKIMVPPFVPQRPTCRDEDGSEPVRVALLGTSAHLMDLAQ